MKLLKRIAVLSLCVLAVSGCTKSSVSTQAPIMPEVIDDAGLSDSEMDLDKLALLETEEEYVEKVALIEEDEEEVSMFDWEQVSDEVADLFGDTDFYPASVEMNYEADEENMTVDLTWVLKNGTTEEDAMAYAATMVQKFNDILAVQLSDVEFASTDSFGGIWEQFALNVKVGTEDGTWLIEKSYEPGADIDLKLPEVSGNGPMVDESETEERISPSAKN